MYEQMLGAAWHALPASVRSTHRAGESRGAMQVTWGDGALARIVAWTLGFPRPSASAEVVLHVQHIAEGRLWVRRMGETTFASQQFAYNGLLVEQFGPFVCAFRLLPIPYGLLYQQDYAALRVLRWQLRLPSWASPRVTARIFENEGAVRTEVEIIAPFLGRVLCYAGITRPCPQVASREP